MNLREMRLLVFLLVILGVGGIGISVYQWFYKPLMDSNLQIRKLIVAIDQKQVQLDTTIDERKLLERARLMSLSPKPNLARAEYDKYLYPLLQACKLDIETFAPAPATELKGTPPPPGGTALKPQHQIIATQVRAKGELDGLVKALELIQKTPLMHRIKILNIDRDLAAKKATDLLTINMTIEALIVSKAEEHADGPFAPDLRLIVLETVSSMNRAPTGIALLPWIVGPTGPVAQERIFWESGYRRQYADVAIKNIFNGKLPLPKIEVAKEPTSEFEDDPGLDVREYVRLDTTDPIGGVAYLRNLVFKTPPLKLRTAAWSGYDTFRVKNEWGNKVLVKGKVLRIDQRDVYFQVREDVYRIHIGQSLWDAMKKALTENQIEQLNLTSRVDQAWGAAETKEYLQELAKERKKKSGR